MRVMTVRTLFETLSATSLEGLSYAPPQATKACAFFISSNWKPWLISLNGLQKLTMPTGHQTFKAKTEERII